MIEDKKGGIGNGRDFRDYITNEIVHSDIARYHTCEEILNLISNPSEFNKTLLPNSEGLWTELNEQFKNMVIEQEIINNFDKFLYQIELYHITGNARIQFNEFVQKCKLKSLYEK